MSLGLLVPAFLAGLVALAVPVYLHLRHSEKTKPFRFPSLMFLEKLPIRTSSRRRIVDPLLLLLRALALGLIALAFARPFFSRDVAAQISKRPRAVVLLLDRSASMSHKDVWPAAVDSAKQVIQTIGPGDQIAVVLFDEEAEIAHAFTADQGVARAAVQAAKPGQRGTRYAAALRAARQLLTAAPDATHEVVVITDAQRSGVAGLAGLDLPTGMAIRTVAVGTKDKGNTAVTGIDIRRITTGDKTTIAAQARVTSHDLPGPRKVRATLALNGRASGARDVTLPQSGDFTVAFDAVPLPAGHVNGTVVVDADAMAVDDTFHFTLPDEDELRVLLVVPDDAAANETLFFERALAIGKAPAVTVERRRPSTIDTKSLEKAGLVVYWDSPPLAGPIEPWVKKGGGAVVVAGHRLAAHPGTSPIVPASISGLADRIADRGGTFGELSIDNALFIPFRDARASLGAARFWRYPRLQPSNGTDVIARFDDGLPAIVERRESAGRVVMLAVPLDADNGDLPLQPTFLPLMRRLVLHTSGHESSPLWKVTGESWNPQAIVRTPVVSTPSGEIIRPAADSAGAAVALTEAGVYSLYDGRVGGEPAAVVAVNPPPGESDLTPVDPRELLLGVRLSNDAVDAAQAKAAPKELENRQSLWRLVIVLSALVLIAETLLATHGWRGVAGRVTASPSQSD
ncbi:MAG TPA: VWA domain-containing protein [Gemmatimonadaceae bacterium]|nr:VWA domain-containing protein [Gemmatimonadaceae bacterium]